MKAFMKTIAALICVLCMGAASTAGVKANAAAPNAVVPNAVGRYILSATVTHKAVITGEDLDGNLVTYLYCTFVDDSGEAWVYAYDLDESAEVPPMNQSVILIMNTNGTTNDTDDDMIEDILWCNCTED